MGRSDIDGLLFHERLEFRTQGLLRNQIDGSPEQVFEVGLGAAGGPEGLGTIESHHEVEVAVAGRLVAGDGAEEFQCRYAETFLQNGIVGAQVGSKPREILVESDPDDIGGGADTYGNTDL